MCLAISFIVLCRCLAPSRHPVSATFLPNHASVSMKNELPCGVINPLLLERSGSLRRYLYSVDAVSAFWVCFQSTLLHTSYFSCLLSGKACCKHIFWDFCTSQNTQTMGEKTSFLSRRMAFLFSETFEGCSSCLLSVRKRQ